MGSGKTASVYAAQRNKRSHEAGGRPDAFLVMDNTRERGYLTVEPLLYFV
jgi:hypothetical protein